MAFFSALAGILGLTSTTTAPITGAAAATAASTTTGLTQAAILGGGVVAPTTTLAINPLTAVAVTGTIASTAKGIEAQRAQGKAADSAKQAQELRAKRAQERVVKQAQIRRAQNIARSEVTTGGGGVSQLAGIQGGLASSEGFERSGIAQTQALNTRLSVLESDRLQALSKGSLIKGATALTAAMLEEKPEIEDATFPRVGPFT